MDFLRWIESWRNPFLDAVFSTLTNLGGEVFFIVIALTVFWCMDKKRGYYLLFTGLFGVLGVQILKMAFRIPRPWVKDPSFTIVESAREGATGYSFPSGHTQNATTLYGSLAYSAKRRWLRIGGWVLCLLIAFSRLYLGVHTPLDVGVSLALGIAIVLVLRFVMDRSYDTRAGLWYLIGAAVLLSLGNLLFVELFPFPADTLDAVNYTDAVALAWELLGMVLALCVAYPLDRHVIRFGTQAVWWAQILKVAVGLGLMVGLRTLLKAPLNALLGFRVGDCVRYFLMIVTVAAVVPCFFRYLPKKAGATQTETGKA